MPTPQPTRRGRGRPVDPIPTSQFLAAAQQVFAEGGYAGASMSAIADVCGVTKAALYNHFRGKEALYLAVMEDIAGSLGALIDRALAEPGDPFERLDALGAAVVRYLGGHPQAARLLSREMVDAGPFLRSSRAAIIARVLDATTRLLAAGIDAGAFARQDARQLAGSIVGLHLHWFAARPVSETLAGGDPFTPEQIEIRVRAVQAQVRRLCGDTPGS